MGWGSRRERSWGAKKKREIEEGEEWKWTEGGEKTEKRERENKQWMARRGTERLRWGIR
jgi:hypothetical protein